jgi:hypothetical protein
MFALLAEWSVRNKLAQCQYNAKYFDYETNRGEKVSKRLMDKVAARLDHNKALFCIGYKKYWNYILTWSSQSFIASSSVAF